MSNPQLLDFSAEPEQALTVLFPGKEKYSCEIPTMDELNMATFQWIAANGDEWQELFDSKDQSGPERKRFDHLNSHLCYALCAEVPRNVVDRLTTKQKARVIVSFMTASPGMLELVKEQLKKTGEAPKERKSKTSR